MKKLVRNLEALGVESFHIAAPAMNGRGTVEAHAIKTPGEPIDQMLSRLVCPDRPGHSRSALSS